MSLASPPPRPSSARAVHRRAISIWPRSARRCGATAMQILRPTIVVALFTFVVVIMIPPKYQSESRVLVVGRDNMFLRPDVDKDIIDRGTVDPEAVISQAQLVLSRDLATEVIAKLKLNEHARVRSGARRRCR